MWPPQCNKELFPANTEGPKLNIAGLLCGSDPHDRPGLFYRSAKAFAASAFALAFATPFYLKSLWDCNGQLRFKDQAQEKMNARGWEKVYRVTWQGASSIPLCVITAERATSCDRKEHQQ